MCSKLYFYYISCVPEWSLVPTIFLQAGLVWTDTALTIRESNYAGEGVEEGEGRGVRFPSVVHPGRHSTAERGGVWW